MGRKTCEIVAEKLNAKGFKAAHYHAEVPPAQRNKVQEDFINDRTPIICATIAFGMGIDKSNVRFVIHYNLPRNLEGYYQEIGRAGRDGSKAEALLFFSYSDVQSYRDMIEQGESSLEQKELKLAKLNRMYQFAEAPVCRRKTVLNYFGEPYDATCGNCDICQNPPQQFDGTTAVQKALSAILRTHEKVGMNLLVDILRGSQRREIFDAGYHQIKTYGAGKEHSFDAWLYLLSQMLHTGLVEIAYDDGSCLKVTAGGRAVLFEEKKVNLVMPVPKTAAPKEKLPVLKARPQGEVQREELFDRLVALRREVAQQQGVPPYIVFTDATLTDMAEKRPFNDYDFQQVSGVGERKLQLYGNAFIREIRRYMLEKTNDGVRVVGSSALQTWDLYRQKQSLEQIAEARNISVITVQSHLALMYEGGEMLNLYDWISPEEHDLIQGALPLFKEPYQVKEISEHFDDQFGYDKIRWAIADYRRNRVRSRK